MVFAHTPHTYADSLGHGHMHDPGSEAGCLLAKARSIKISHSEDSNSNCSTSGGGHATKKGAGARHKDGEEKVGMRVTAEQRLRSVRWALTHSVGMDSADDEFRARLLERRAREPEYVSRLRAGRSGQTGMKSASEMGHWRPPIATDTDTSSSGGGSRAGGGIVFNPSIGIGIGGIGNGSSSANTNTPTAKLHEWRQRRHQRQRWQRQSSQGHIVATKVKLQQNKDHKEMEQVQVLKKVCFRLSAYTA